MATVIDKPVKSTSTAGKSHYDEEVSAKLRLAENGVSWPVVFWLVLIHAGAAGSAVYVLMDWPDSVFRIALDFGWHRCLLGVPSPVDASELCDVSADPLAHSLDWWSGWRGAPYTVGFGAPKAPCVERSTG